MRLINEELKAVRGARGPRVLHARACDAGVVEPVDLAAWTVRFQFDDQDFFEVDPVRDTGALGEAGLAAYSDAVGGRRDGDSFALRYARERLAILDATSTRSCGCSVGTDEPVPSSFASPRRCASSGSTTRRWRGPSAASRRPAAGRSLSCNDLARAVHDAREEPGATRGARAAATLQRADVRGFVDAFLGDDEPELAWSAAAAAPWDALGSEPFKLLHAMLKRERAGRRRAVGDGRVQGRARVRVLNVNRQAALRSDLAIYARGDRRRIAASGLTPSAHGQRPGSGESGSLSAPAETASYKPTTALRQVPTARTKR